MAIRVVRLGSPRSAGEGVRLGTVRRPPRGVPKSEYASSDLHAAWLPSLAPSEAPLKQAQTAVSAGDDRAWKSFVRRYRAEMKTPDNRALLDTLAALSQGADFAVGCYCADERRCPRSILRELLLERGAKIADA